MGTITLTPLRDRIAARRPERLTPRPISERMNPFARKLAERALTPRDFTWYNGALTPTDDGGAA